MSTIFVRNLPWSTTNDELREFFTTNLPKAEVTSAEVQFNKQGRSKGWALVTFGSEDGAASAINELNDADFTSGDNTRQLQIREDRGAKAPRAAGTGAAQPVVDAEPSTSLFVGNLPWRTSWQDLKDMFADYNVQYTTIKTGYDGRSRGYGIARFDTIEEAEKAIDGMNGKEYHGRTITVRFDSKPRAPRPQQQNEGAAAIAEGTVAQEFNADAATYQEAPGAGAAGSAAAGPLAGGYQQF